MAKRLLKLGVAALVCCAAQSWAGQMPDWFQPDPDNPYKIYEAWRSLSTRQAVLYCSGEGGVLAGVLEDEDARPLPLTPLTVQFHDGARAYPACLQTDANGNFIVYGANCLRVRPWSDEGRAKGAAPEKEAAPADAGGYQCIAYPGCPYAELAVRYAQQKTGGRRCAANEMMRGEQRAFYVLTCSGESTFDAAGFEPFAKALLVEDLERPPAPRPEAKAGYSGQQEGRQKVEYQLEVLDHEGRLVPRATVRFSFHDLEHGWGGDVAETDSKGRCAVKEYLLPDRPSRYYASIERSVTIDAGERGVGPVVCDLKPDAVNAIRLRRPGIVRGKVVDHNGNPVLGRIQVRYKRCAYWVCEALVPLRSDGSFCLDRVMPGWPFRIALDYRSLGWTRRPPAATEAICLAPGEEKRDIVLQVPLAAAVCGVVKNGQGELLGELRGFAYFFQDGEWGGLGIGQDGVFYRGNLGQGPFRFRLDGLGFGYNVSDWYELEPGELRFFTLTPRKNDREHVRALMSELTHPVESVRDHSAEALIGCGAEAVEAVPALAKALGDSYWRVRWQAARALWQLGPAAAEAVPALTQAVEDPSKWVRQFAIGALARIGPGAAPAAGALVKALADKNAVERGWAAGALGCIGDASAEVVSALVRALRDESWGVRTSAARSLGRIGPAAKAAVPELEVTMKEAEPGLAKDGWNEQREAHAAIKAALEEISGTTRRQGQR